MGHSLHVTGFSAAAAETALARLGLARGAAAGEKPGAALQISVHGERMFLWTPWRRRSPPSDAALAALSAEIGEVLSLALDEGAMGARTACFSGGRLLWSAEGCADDVPALVVTGRPPLDADRLAALARDYEISLGLQPLDEADPFSLAVELFVALTGVRYDEADEDEVFEPVHLIGDAAKTPGVLPGGPPRARPWWRFW